MFEVHVMCSIGAIYGPGVSTAGGSLEICAHSPLAVFNQLVLI